jgi:hypothetical protein
VRVPHSEGVANNTDPVRSRVARDLACADAPCTVSGVEFIDENGWQPRGYGYENDTQKKN